MTEEQLLKRRKSESLQKAIRDGGFYGRSGVWNSIKTFPNDNHIYRERVETIIVRDGKEVFVKKKPSGEYFLPGGSTEKDCSHMDQAVNECREEARINVRNIESTGITYKETHEPPDWAKKESEVEWNATYTEIYVAEYDSMYKGKIDSCDKDPFILSGKFYSTKECFKFFRKEHREALLWFLKNFNEKDEPITESYVSNYFKNKRLLKKISSSPEVERSTVEQIISILKKEYSTLSSKSKIQRERKRKDVGEIFHPVLNLDFPDGCTITIAICFDDSSITDGMAIHTDSYGNIVVVYPNFFKEKKEDQIFTLLHEIGHVRLDHLSMKNTPRTLTGHDRMEELRSKQMRKGKCIYPEINADLYAVLNGAYMYTILNASIRQDSDEQYDYRFTNAELANRYSNVFKKYNSLRKYNESESGFDDYDISCLAIYEMVYENPKLTKESENNKNKLYNLIYECCIHNGIKDDEYVKESDEKYRLSKNKEEEIVSEASANRVEAHAKAYNQLVKEKTSIPCPKNIHKKVANLIKEKTSYRNIFEKNMESIYNKFMMNHIIYENTDPASENLYQLLKIYCQ